MSTEISPEDILFLKQLGFAEDVPDEEDSEDNTWISWYMDIEDHPYIDNLHLSVNVEPGYITAHGKEGNEPFLEKPFTRENILGIMKFLGIPVTAV